MNADKKKRIAHIGNSTSVQEEKLQPDDVVNDIMKAMDDMHKSDNNFISYKQLQEFKLKRQVANAISNKTTSSNSINLKLHSFKQTKKVLPEKRFPLMAKCQKSWKYLKKNRCMPKPRAHVGFVPKPTKVSQLRTVKNFHNLYVSEKNCVNNKSTERHFIKNGAAVKSKDNFKKREQIHTVINNSESLQKSKKMDSLFTSDSFCNDSSIGKSSDHDSDSEYEKFIQKHQYKSKSNKRSRTFFDSSNETRVKSKKKKRKHDTSSCVNSSNIKSRLSTDEKNTSDIRMQVPHKSSMSKYNPSSKVIVAEKDTGKSWEMSKIYTSDEDSLSDSMHVAEASYHYDSSDSLEGNGSDGTHDLTNVKCIKDNVSNFCQTVEEKDALLTENEIPFSEITPTSETNIRNPKCYVLLKRDAALDQSKYFSVNKVSSDNLSREDDCIVLNESTEDKSIDRNLDEIQLSNSRCSSELLNTKLDSNIEMQESRSLPSGSLRTCRSRVQRDPTFHEKCISNLNCLSDERHFTSPQAVPRCTSELVNQKECSIDELSLLNPPEDYIMNNVDEADECIIVCEKTNKEVLNLPITNSVKIAESESEMENTRMNEESSVFNVQILSVQSVEQSTSEIIDIASECDETESINMNNSKVINHIEVTNEKETSDSDIEIICLRSDIPISEDTLNKTEYASKEMNDSLHLKQIATKTLDNIHNKDTACKTIVEDDDCVIINQIDSQRNKTCSESNDYVQLESELEKNLKEKSKNCSNENNASGCQEISKSSIKKFVSPAINLNANAKIFEILEKIDFDLVSKVMKDTSSIYTRKTESVCNTLIETSLPDKSISDSVDTLSAKNQVKRDDEDDITSKSYAFKSNSLISKEAGKKKNALENVNLNENNLIISGTCTNNNDFNQNKRDSQSNCEQLGINDNGVRVKFSPTSRNLRHKTIQDNSVYKRDSCHELTKISDSENPSRNNSNNISSLSSNHTNSVKFDASFSNKDKSNSCSLNTIVNKDYKLDETIALKHQMKKPIQLRDDKSVNLEIYKKTPSDELDVIAAKSIQDLDGPKKLTIIPLLELYKVEYKKYREIKSTEENVSAGLKLLEENQANKLKHISSSIKNLMKNDTNFYKATNELEGCNECCTKMNKTIKTEFFSNNAAEENRTMKSASCENTQAKPIDTKNDIKVFNPSVVERATEMDSSGLPNDKQVYDHLTKIVCAECGKNAVAACLGCAKVYYCSEECGKTFWSKIHHATCSK